MASILLLSSLFASFVYAQDDAIGGDESGMTESFLLIDAMDYYMAHPINLRESPDALANIPGISTAFIRECKSILKQYPHIESVNDLISLFPHSLDSSVATLLLNCTNLSSSSVFSGRIRTRLSSTLQKSRGFVQHAFLGSEEAFMNRILIGNNNVTTSFSYGKHSGETYLHGMLHGALSYSQHNLMLIIGDQTIQTGLGTVFSSGISMPNATKPTQRALHWSTSIRPNTSLIEHSNFRGISLQHRSNPFGIALYGGMIYASRNRYAYRNDNHELTGFPAITYARTITELTYREGVKEQRLACFGEMNHDSHSFAISALYQFYDADIAPSARNIGEKEQFLSSLDYQWSNKTLTISGNALIDKRAHAGGLLMFHHRAQNQQQACIIRYFDSELHSPLGVSPGRFGFPGNDMGIQALFNGEYESIDYASSFEMYANVSVPHNRDTRKRGMRSILQLSSKNKESRILCRIMHELQAPARITSTYEYSWRARCDYTHSNTSMNAIFRVEYHHHELNQIANRGIGYSFELKSAKKTHPWNWSFRFAWSNTDSFTSALYLPETGLPGQLLIEPLYGIMTMLGAKIGYDYKNWSCSLLIRQRHKPREQTLGSGLMEIQGNMETECHFQTDITL
ncbi:MAG: hypothetical protein FJ219_07105 [Ignavibacteria bacterium]|nr:hypothetical protein [Ignavibacteria bacterium]